MASNVVPGQRDDTVKVEPVVTLRTIRSDSSGLSGPSKGDVEGVVGVFDAVRKNPVAFSWSIYAIFVMVTSAYTNSISGSVLGIPQFRKDFGYQFGGHYVLPAAWQAAYYGATNAAGVVGAFLAANVADQWGRKITFTFLLAFKFLSITLEFVATTNQVYFGGILLSGFCAGGFGTLCMTYIGEIAPQRLRGVLTAAAPISMTLGSLTASLIINFTGDQKTHWAYRTAFASEYSFAGFTALFLPFIPESPWWSTDRRNDGEALESLAKLGYDPSSAEVHLSLIKRTLAKTKNETMGATYLECFRRSNLRRTIVSLMPLACQALIGVSFVASYSTYYQQLAGFSTQASFHLSIVQGLLSLVGNICSLFLIDRVGRRSLSFWGLCLLTLLLLLTGGLAVAATPGAIKGTVALLLLYCFVFNVTIGATAYTILAEIPTPRLRVKTASMAFALENGLFTMWGFVLPYLFNPDKANLGAKVTFIFGALSILCTIYLWVFQPECSHLSFEELDELFMNKVPARKFKTRQSLDQANV
ncbi:hypothetical protein LTR84_010241 [Exophiala bonariae]|uniref:Major facilitator superfamily (MFS) profile domain-containing protein n=1 Tax=Exophiala bonariae TaxID=1690606 RepID=A0AAV9MX06_9EURO|nr:hypothetical protein LTR84_010241 [Exophiala bonariae]